MNEPSANDSNPVHDASTSAHYLRSILDALTTHIAILDRRGIILEVNAAWRQFADANGLNLPDHGVGSNYLDVCDHANGQALHAAPDVAAGIRDVIAGKLSVFTQQYPCHGPDQPRWFILRVTRFEIDQQVRLVVAQENITGRTLAEQALRKAHDELEQRVEQRTAQLQRTNIHLEAEIAKRIRAQERAAEWHNELAHVSRLATMGQMAAGLAHELNQPLWAVANFVRASKRLLRADDPDLDRARHAMDKAAGQAERAGQIITRLREFIAKDESKRIACDINQLIEETIDWLGAMIRQADVEIDHDFQGDLPPVHADPIQIQQVVVNLVRNAIEAMSENQTPRLLAIRTRRDPHESNVIEVRISDTGSAADPQVLTHLFDPFYTSKPEGMGMGLAISRSIIDNHGGTITASINDTGGMTFRFTLTIHERGTDEKGKTSNSP